jgi:hypothetical protein
MASQATMQVPSADAPEATPGSPQAQVNGHGDGVAGAVSVDSVGLGDRRGCNKGEELLES